MLVPSLQQQDPTAAQQYTKPYVPPAPPVKIPTASVIPPVHPAAAPVAGVYSLPQYQQAQQLFQRDAQTITPKALESVKAALASSETEHKAEIKKKALVKQLGKHGRIQHLQTGQRIISAYFVGILVTK